MCVVGATTATRATRPSASIRCATCSPNVVLPAAGVAEARNASPAWSKTAAAAACCHARSGRDVGHGGRERPAAGREGAISYVTERGKLAADPDEPRGVQAPCPAHENVVRSMIVPVQVTHFSDPGCPWAWSASPAIAALRWRYGEQLDWRLVMIGLTENGAVYEKRGYTPANPSARLPQVPPPRNAVRDRAARTDPRHVADVPRRRGRAEARTRAGIRGVPRAPVRAVHVHPVPRGPGRTCAMRSPGSPASTPTRSSPPRTTARPRRCSNRTATMPARPRAARPSSKASRPTPTAACASPRRA